MESFLLDIGISWTWSKILPYIISLLCGIIIQRLINKRLKKKFLKSLSLLIIVIPFVLYFIFSPIYKGDFSNDYQKLKISTIPIKPKRLTVIAIPGCSYCYGAIDNLITLKRRINCDTIDFIVVSKDKEQLKWYDDKAKGELHVYSALENENLLSLANGHFPTFILNDGHEIYTWSNDHFGVIAKDFVEDKLK